MNPYEAPRSKPAVVTPPTSNEELQGHSIWNYWFPVTIGTGISGAVFGAIGGPLGMVVGGLIATPIAAAVTFVGCVAIRLIAGPVETVFPPIGFGGTCGCASGVLSVSMLAGLSDEALFAMIAAGVVGAIGGGLGSLFRSRSIPSRKPA